jgi:hypothetical protein
VLFSSDLFYHAGRELGHAAHLSGAHADKVANADPNRLGGCPLVKVRGREDRTTFRYQFWIFERCYEILEVDELPFSRHDGSGFFQVSVLSLSEVGVLWPERAGSTHFPFHGSKAIFYSEVLDVALLRILLVAKHESPTVEQHRRVLEQLAHQRELLNALRDAAQAVLNHWKHPRREQFHLEAAMARLKEALAKCRNTRT